MIWYENYTLIRLLIKQLLSDYSLLLFLFCYYLFKDSVYEAMFIMDLNKFLGFPLGCGFSCFVFLGS